MQNKKIMDLNNMIRSLSYKAKNLLDNSIDIYLSIIGVFFGLSILSLYIFISKTIHLLMLGFALMCASILYFIMTLLQISDRQLP